MIYVIDNVARKIVKATKVYDSARYWAELLCKGDYRIQYDERRSWTAYSAEDLAAIIENTTGRKPRKDALDNLAALITLAVEAARELPQDDTAPAALKKKLGRDLPLMSGERMLSPEEAAGFGKTTAAGPEAQEGRRDDGVTRTATVSRMLGKGKAAHPPSKLHDRPKGGKTGAVWDIADKVAATMPNADKKTLRKAVLAECDKAGANPAMAATQYSRWYNVREASAAT